MLVFDEEMRTGFNTDVRHEGHLYHVQTEDRGEDNPILESLIYVGGTIIAKKLTPYSEQLSQGATEEGIASLLKRQHQVIIAAIKAGRIEDLVRHSRKQQDSGELRKKRSSGELGHSRAHRSTSSLKRAGTSDSAVTISPAATAPSKPVQRSGRNSGGLKVGAPASSARGNTAGLNFDQVIADHLKRNNEQARLDVTVLTPEGFTAGKNVGLRVQVTRDSKPEYDAVVTIKIIGTAFKPQVLIGRVGKDGVASFSLSLPAFTAGTAAIVIEAQSNTGRGELKNLIRRL
jgi:hypothetical protein